MKCSFFILVISLLGLCLVQAQDLYYYGPNSRLVENENDARILKEVQHKSEKRYIITTRIKSRNETDARAWKFQKRERIKINKDGSLSINQKGVQLSSNKITRKIVKGKNGLFEFSELRNGIPSRTGYSSRFLPIHLEDSVTEFHSNGQVKSISQYNDNQLVSNRIWLSNGEHYFDSVFYSVDELPQFKFGDEFFNKYILQSLNNSKFELNQINDIVEIGWVIMETGKMEGVIALKGKISELNQFLVKVIAEMPGDWQAAKLEGKTVRYFMSLPLNFRHTETQLQDLEITSGILYYNSY